MCLCLYTELYVCIYVYEYQVQITIINMWFFLKVVKIYRYNELLTAMNNHFAI